MPAAPVPAPRAVPPGAPARSLTLLGAGSVGERHVQRDSWGRADRRGGVSGWRAVPSGRSDSSGPGSVARMPEGRPAMIDKPSAEPGPPGSSRSFRPPGSSRVATRTGATRRASHRPHPASRTACQPAGSPPGAGVCRAGPRTRPSGSANLGRPDGQAVVGRKCPGRTSTGRRRRRARRAEGRSVGRHGHLKRRSSSAVSKLRLSGVAS
jgi:hypothetical protein